ncbi:MAG TPA: deoxyribose-phosphate aldolase [Candidatus Limnocylindria bacterium]|nr:deoxyribose-phosphate aldolase [Candidatus Limnocylindria bacterium]
MTANRRPAVPLEHRLTQPNASLEDLSEAIALVTEHDLATLIVNPWLVKAARRELGRSSVQIGAVIGYPYGGQLLAVKAFEASKALEQGATQIEFVLNGGALRSGADETVYNDLLAVVDMAHSALALASVVVEPDRLPVELISKACRLAERAGVDCVVTSSGAASAEHAIELTGLLRDSVGPRVEVKATGRFERADQLEHAIAAGASRLSSSFSADLLTDAGALQAVGG